MNEDRSAQRQSSPVARGRIIMLRPRRGPSRRASSRRFTVVCRRTRLRRLILVESRQEFRLFNHPRSGDRRSPPERGRHGGFTNTDRKVFAERDAAHGALARPSPGSGRPCRRRGDAEPGRAHLIDRLSEGLSDTGEHRQPMASASFAWSRTMSARRFMPGAARASRPSCPRRGTVRGGLLPPSLPAPRLRHPKQTRRRGVHRSTIMSRRDHVAGAGRGVARASARANILVAGGTRPARRR